MRVLWLTPAQLPAVTGESAMVGGGWLEGLRLALERFEPGIELGIAARSSSPRAPVQQGNATYFALGPWGRSRYQSAAEAWGRGGGDAQTISAARHVIRQFRPDLVHVHGTEHALGFAAIGSGIPSVATLQGIATVCEHFMLDVVPLSQIIRSSATRSFLRGAGLIPNYLSMRRRAVDERAIIRGLDHFMGQTEWDKTVLKFLNSSAKYFHTECVVQPVYYEQQWSPPQSPEKTIFCVGKAAPYKGLETLLEAVRVLRMAGSRSIRLRVAGAVRGSALWPTLSAIVRRGDIQSQVVWLGPLSAAGLVSESRRANVFVHPSHIDNQPNSLIEAMLMGMPIVAGAVGGVPELLEHETNGLLYHDRDPYALAGALARLLDDEAYARSLGREARRTAHVRHDPETIARRTSAVYDAILGDSNAKRCP